VEQRTRLRVAATGALVALACAACHPAAVRDLGPEDVEVSGVFGSVPTVSFPTPFSVEESSVTTVIDGDGPELVAGSAVLVDGISFDGGTGDVVSDTYAGLVPAYLFSEESLGEGLWAVLDGAGAYDRLLALDPADTDGIASAVVTVVDVSPARAHGEPVSPGPDLPAVTLADDGAPSIAKPAGAPPADLVQQVLIKGDGEQVAEGDTVLAQYTAVGWSDGAVIDTTWGEQALPKAIVLADVAPGLRTGLLDQAAGSQVMLVVPPDQAFGTDTVVFVVDVLDVVHDPDATPTPTVTSSTTPTTPAPSPSAS
jgi:peptidylprolyl isomerase